MITEQAQRFGLLFHTYIPVMYLFFQKWVGLHCGRLFDLSGHPVGEIEENSISAGSVDDCCIIYDNCEKKLFLTVSYFLNILFSKAYFCVAYQDPNLHTYDCEIQRPK
jgi:hypothetical protein